jgi:hypothetical protein
LIDNSGLFSLAGKDHECLYLPMEKAYSLFAAAFLARLALPNCLGFLRVLPEVPLLIFPRFER